MIETLAQIKGDKFTAGIVLHDDVVVEAAPIVGYMKRQKWTRGRVREYCRKNGWTVSVVHETRRPGSPSGKAGVS
jgi:hypothetical protein